MYNSGLIIFITAWDVNPFSPLVCSHNICYRCLTFVRNIV